MWLYISIGIAIVFITSFVLLFRKCRTLYKKEEWIPVVKEDGAVVGKVTRSEIIRMGNKFLHPGFRVAVVFDSKIYLQPRSVVHRDDPDMLDHPLINYLTFGLDVKKGIDSFCRRVLGKGNVKTQFLVKYKYTSKLSNKLVYVYLYMPEDILFFNHSFFCGKLWTIPQIQENLGKGVFSSLFEGEFDYLQAIIKSMPKEKVKRGV